MNTKNKKALYESIMKSVSKTVKRKLNEDTRDYNYYLNELLVALDDADDADVKENVIDQLYNLLRELEGYVSDLYDGDMSYEELNKRFSIMCRVLNGRTKHIYTDADDLK